MINALNGAPVLVISHCVLLKTPVVPARPVPNFRKQLTHLQDWAPAYAGAT